MGAGCIRGRPHSTSFGKHATIHRHDSRCINQISLLKFTEAHDNQMALLVLDQKATETKQEKQEPEAQLRPNGVTRSGEGQVTLEKMKHFKPHLTIDAEASLDLKSQHEAARPKIMSISKPVARKSSLDWETRQGEIGEMGELVGWPRPRGHRKSELRGTRT